MQRTQTWGNPTRIRMALKKFQSFVRCLAIAQKSVELRNVICLIPSDTRECDFLTRDALCIQCQIDSQRLGAAIYNLLLNACQALKRSPSPKKIEIALWIDGSSICIRVEDNGDGVPDRVRNVLFQPFVTADRISGIGLGLTIADEAAREHGGSLNLEKSIPGKTAFVLRLPTLILEAALIEERSG
jgi:signal transduction histidine kinase